MILLFQLRRGVAELADTPDLDLAPYGVGFSPSPTNFIAPLEGVFFCLKIGLMGIFISINTCNLA